MLEVAGVSYSRAKGYGDHFTADIQHIVFFKNINCCKVGAGINKVRDGDV